VADYKSECLARYYESRLRPRSVYGLGLTFRCGRPLYAYGILEQARQQLREDAESLKCVVSNAGA
jgi:hypothetical protein